MPFHVPSVGLHLLGRRQLTTLLPLVGLLGLLPFSSPDCVLTASRDGSPCTLGRHCNRRDFACLCCCTMSVTPRACGSGSAGGSPTHVCMRCLSYFCVPAWCS